MKNQLTALILMISMALIPAKSHAVDGTPSTGSFDVVNVSSIVATTATGSLVVISTPGSLRSRVTVGFAVFSEGRDWFVGTSTVTAAASLTGAINAKNIPVTASFAGENTPSISLAADDIGTLYNGIALKTSTPTALSVSAPTLLGGQDDAIISINDIPLIQGRDWFAQDTASNTAVNIAAGINHNDTVNNLVNAFWVGNDSTTLLLRAVLSPEQYKLASSVPSDITASGPTMTGGTSGNITPSFCDLGAVDELPTSGYPAGCSLFLKSDPTSQYYSTEAVTESASWTKSDPGSTDSELADLSASTAAIASGAGIDDGAITSAKIGAGAVTTGKIGSGAVTQETLAAGISLPIVDNSVTTSKLGDGAVVKSKMGTFYDDRVVLVDAEIADLSQSTATNASGISDNGGEITALSVSTQANADNISSNSSTIGELDVSTQTNAGAILVIQTALANPVFASSEVINVPIDVASPGFVTISTTQITLTGGRPFFVIFSFTIDNGASDKDYNIGLYEDGVLLTPFVLEENVSGGTHELKSFHYANTSSPAGLHNYVLEINTNSIAGGAQTVTLSRVTAVEM